MWRLAGYIYTFHSFIVIDGNDGSDASYRSANAAMCAAEQGHFWDYHDTLYANQVSESASLFTDERLTTMAQNLNLDMTPLLNATRQNAMPLISRLI